MLRLGKKTKSLKVRRKKLENLFKDLRTSASFLRMSAKIKNFSKISNSNIFSGKTKRTFPTRIYRRRNGQQHP